MVTKNHEAVEYAIRVLSVLRRQVGDETLLRALGAVTTTKRIVFRDFPTGEVEENIPVLGMGRLTIATKVTVLGDPYTSVVRDEGTLIVPIERDKDGRPYVIMTKQFRGAAGSVFTELSAGMPHKGESSLDAAARELKEETGYEVVKIEPLGNRVLWSGPGFTTDRQRPFIAEVVKAGDRSRSVEDAREIREIISKPLDEAAKTIAHEGRMPEDDKCDTKSGFGILAAYVRLRR